MADIILVDFAGTLITTQAIDRANELRSDILNRSLPDAKEHAHSEKLYANNRERVEALTGLHEDMLIQYTTATHEKVLLSGEEAQNSIATTLFQIGMYQAAKEYGQKMFVAGMIETLTQLRNNGYELAIISGVRTDIISGILELTQVDIFDYILGQPPQLGVSNEDQYETLDDLGTIKYVIGDKASDMQPAEYFEATSIFVDWGHPIGGEEEIADYTVSEAKELLEIID